MHPPFLAVFLKNKLLKILIFPEFSINTAPPEFKALFARKKEEEISILSERTFRKLTL